MSTPAKVYLALGSNLGDRAELLKTARQDLKNLPLDDFETSSIYESAPYQGAQQPPYYNQVVCGRTSLSPEQLLEACQRIEKKMGRIRKKRWESRLIDIDILYYEDLILASESLILPHTDLVNRGFVLLPLAELAPSRVDPRFQESIDTLLKRWENQTEEPIPVCMKSFSKG